VNTFVEFRLLLLYMFYNTRGSTPSSRGPHRLKLAFKVSTEKLLFHIICGRVPRPQSSFDLFSFLKSFLKQRLAAVSILGMQIIITHDFILSFPFQSHQKQCIWSIWFSLKVGDKNKIFSLQIQQGFAAVPSNSAKISRSPLLWHYI
jgi:hypothetical protein